MQTPACDTRAGCEVARATSLARMQLQSAPSTSGIVPSVVRFEMGESPYRQGDLHLTPSLTPTCTQLNWENTASLDALPNKGGKALAFARAFHRKRKHRTLRYLRGDDSAYVALQRLAKLKRSQRLTDIVAGSHTLRYACTRFQRDSASGVQARDLFVFGVKHLVVRSNHNATRSLITAHVEL